MMKQQKNVIPINIAIIGAGGHGKVVAEILDRNGINTFNLIDDCPNKIGTYVQGRPVLDFEKLAMFSCFHIAIGCNRTRKKIYLKQQLTSDFLSVVSCEAYIANTAIIKCGTLIAANSVVSVDSIVGIGCIINHGAIVEHDCRVGDFCHLAPNSTILGGACLGERVFLGSGAVVLPGVEIGDDVIIGAGAVVTSNIIDSCTVVGLPAKRI